MEELLEQNYTIYLWDQENGYVEESVHVSDGIALIFEMLVDDRYQ
jgi:hypothetical protein